MVIDSETSQLCRPDWVFSAVLCLLFREIDLAATEERRYFCSLLCTVTYTCGEASSLVVSASNYLLVMWDTNRAPISLALSEKSPRTLQEVIDTAS